jgi:hypothetical protein
MGYNARNDEIRDNITRMQREWRTTRRIGDRPPLHCNAFRQRLFVWF